VDALFERLSSLYLMLVGLAVLLPAARLRALAGVGLAFLGLAAAADRVAAPGADSAFSNINQFLALAGVVVVLAALLLTVGVRRHDPGEPGRPGSILTAAPSPLDPLLLAGLGIAALAPHLLLLGLGAMLALASAVRVTLRARRPAALIPLLTGALCLGAALGLILTIRGPLGGQLADLDSGPFSLAAERLLVLLLGGAGLLFAGVPPLHQVPWQRSLAPLSAVLLARVIGAASPEGLLTWQMPAMLVLAGGLAWSAAQRRWTHLAVAGGLLALWSGAGGGAVAGGVLVTWGWVVETGAVAAAPRGITLRARWAGLAALPAALAALPALTAGLRAQVLISVAAVAGCAAGLALQWKRGSRAVRAPLY